MFPSAETQMIQSGAYQRNGYTVTDEDTQRAQENLRNYNDHGDIRPKEQIIKDSEEDAIQKLANDLNIKLNNETKDYLYQYYLQSQRDQWAWDKSFYADNTRYQRAVKDLQKAGLNPFLAIQSLSGSGTNASAGTISGGSITSALNSKRQQETSFGTSFLAILGIVAAAIIHAL